MIGGGNMTQLMPHGSPESDESHRAIGRYVAEFSSLVSAMREAIEWKLRGEDPMISRLALGELTAGQIANGFFAICEHVSDFDEEESRVASRFKVRVTEAIKDRNDFAHGDWVLAQGDSTAPNQGPTLLRTKPGRRAGAHVESVWPVDKLDELSDDLFSLTQALGEFAWLCFGIHPLAEHRGEAVRVREIFRMRENRIWRTGPEASEPWWAGMPSIPVDDGLSI